MTEKTPTRIESDSMGDARSPRRPLLGRPDRAQPALLRDRRGALPAALPACARAREARRGGGQCGARRARRGPRAGDRRRRRRGDRGTARRAFSARRLADRLGHADQHERERGDLEPRDRDARRTPRQQAAGPPERPRQPEPVLERRDPDRHPRRRRRGDLAVAAAVAAHPRAGRSTRRRAPSTT